ncbi:MAG: GH25 family lysozyme [Erysipelotrichaceae bacterium]|nr:GH25 family lysozyme [Lactimicrobium massiliense]MDD6258034.1 GH25 family lysozyme [Erysipelotrichaceae bacterium]MDD6561353.1 GH25 family lysozyme [Lactimicrobium massiliense]
MAKIYGCDISEHNGNFNPAGHGFVIIRVGYGHFVQDKQFITNVNKCIQMGIPFGIYHYSYALNTAQAESEAKYVLQAIAPYKDKISCGVWFDMEDADHWKVNHGWKINHDTIAPICLTFCKIVEAAGYYTGIYCSESWLGYLKPENDRFDKWVASWGRNDGKENRNTSALGSILQYTAIPYDKDVIYRGFIYKKNTQPSSQSTPTPQPATPAVTTGFNVGDTVVPTVLKDVHGNSLKQWDNTYTVTAISGNNLTLSARGQVWAVLPSGNVKKTGSASSAPAKPATPSPIKVGDRVKVIKAVDYNGRSFKTWYSTYTVMELRGNRAVIGVNGVVTAAINVRNITKA